MVSAPRKVLLLLCAVLVCRHAGGEPQPKPRMSKQLVIAIAGRAIEARFPGATAGQSLDATIRPHGIWGVFVAHRDHSGLRGGGEPNAEIRDSDGKVLRVYFAR
jgi:hypothetical protein